MVVKSFMAPGYHQMTKRPEVSFPKGIIDSFLQGPTSRDSDKFILRLPDGMRERLAEVAESQGRTMNAVVIGALAEYLANAKSLESQLAGIEKAILALTDKVSEQNQVVSQIVKESAEKRSVRRRLLKS
jgi:predicted DNA-binding protein